jgi:CheY-like chemotaxis protein
MQNAKAWALILVPDDRRRHRVRAALERDGHEVVSTGSGRRAAELLSDWRRTPDVVVLDMQLSTPDGSSFAEAYRRAPGQHPPIILVPAPEQTDQPVRRRLAEADVARFTRQLDGLDEREEDGLSSAALDLLCARVRMHGGAVAEQRARQRTPASAIAAGAGIAAALIVGIAAAAPAWAGAF